MKLQKLNRFYPLGLVSIAKTTRTELCVALIALFVSVAVTSCNDSTVTAGEFQTIEDAEWKYGSSVRFNQVGDTLPGRVSSIDISIRHTNDYPFANIWMEMRYKSQDSLHIDTLNIFLSDEYGKWKGSGSGPVKLYTENIRPGAEPDDGSQFALRHIMRVDVLTDIEQIGLSYHTIPRVDLDNKTSEK